MWCEQSVESTPKRNLKMDSSHRDHPKILHYHLETFRYQDIKEYFILETFSRRSIMYQEGNDVDGI